MTDEDEIRYGIAAINEQSQAISNPSPEEVPTSLQGLVDIPGGSMQLKNYCCVSLENEQAVNRPVRDTTEPVRGTTVFEETTMKASLMSSAFLFTVHCPTHTISHLTQILAGVTDATGVRYYFSILAHSERGQMGSIRFLKFLT